MSGKTEKMGLSTIQTSLTWPTKGEDRGLAGNNNWKETGTTPMSKSRTRLGVV